jgi:phospholipid transport system transporter-binding protein
VDSSAVSLMLSWLRTANSKNVKLSFINVPDNLLSLANLYGVAESLSLPVDA